MKGPAAELSQQLGEAEGSRTLEAQAMAGAALGAVGPRRNCQTSRVRWRDGKVQHEVNQWWNPLKHRTGSKPGGSGPGSSLWSVIALTRSLRSRAASQGLGDRDESLRRSRGRAAGEKLGTVPVNRFVVNVGTVRHSPFLPQGSGQARRRSMGVGWGGDPVVVRGRESRSHGEGGQRVRSCGTGMAGGRR